MARQPRQGRRVALFFSLFSFIVFSPFEAFFMNYKALLQSAITVVAVMAVVNRVPAIKSIVNG